jgi:hypothetical protein
VKVALLQFGESGAVLVAVGVPVRPLAVGTVGRLGALTGDLQRASSGFPVRVGTEPVGGAAALTWLDGAVPKAVVPLFIRHTFNVSHSTQVLYRSSEMRDAPRSCHHVGNEYRGRPAGGDDRSSVQQQAMIGQLGHAQVVGDPQHGDPG